MIELFNHIARDEKGATAVEYGLILALLFLAILGAVQTLGSGSATTWENTSTTINDASHPSS